MHTVTLTTDELEGLKKILDNIFCMCCADEVVEGLTDQEHEAVYDDALMIKLENA